MTKLVINAKDAILGRLCSYAAKHALLGNTVEVINCEECVIRGNKKSILDGYERKFSMGTYAKGPFHYRKPNMFVKRAIRGMLPYKAGRGRNAFKGIKCYIGVPEDLKNNERLPLDEINILTKTQSRRVGYMRVGEICKAFGWKG